MKPLVIINKAAARVQRAWPTINESLQSHNIEVDLHPTSHPGDATLKTRTALRAGVTTVVAVGGDGTLSEAAEGFFEFDKHVDQIPAPINSSAALAVLPAGTGDDFARGLLGRREKLQTWIDILVAHLKSQGESTRRVDVLYGICDGYKSPFICLNASTMGIGGETASRVAAQGNFMRRFSGEARFAAAAMAALAGWRERRVRIVIDEGQKIIDGPMNLAAVANALYAGGGMMLSPEAKIDDGKLDVVTASGLTRTGVLRELSRIHQGGHIGNPKVQIIQGTRVTIETFSAADAMPIEADGNVRGFTPVAFRVMPLALKFVVR
ncbi:MAG TPA: diacylglycerol kinase family protein [Pyrinomonadaceae bacterium]|nr:diacylglycerol kinase family protein [Pyrinomonadaceae bacterium]